MASNLKISTNLRNAAIAAIAAEFDEGTPPARIEHRTGSPPTNLSDASSGTKLGTNLMSNPAFGSPATGVVTADAITNDASADASGDAGYFRIYKGGAADTAAELQGTSGEAADTPDMVFDEKSIVAGGVIAISSLTLTMPIQ